MIDYNRGEPEGTPMTLPRIAVIVSRIALVVYVLAVAGFLAYGIRLTLRAQQHQADDITNELKQHN